MFRERHQADGGVQEQPVSELFELTGCEGRCRVDYQPKVCDGEIVGLEALLRAETGGSFPEEYLRVVRDQGREHELTLAVLDRVLNDLGAWSKRGYAVPISVNIGSQDLTEAFVGELQAALARADVPGELVELEIHEGTIPRTEHIAILRALKTLGVHISLDDYGTEHADEHALAAFEYIDTVKIDRSLAETGTAYPLARRLQGEGYEVVIEGVPKEKLALVPPGVSVQSYATGMPSGAQEIDIVLSGAPAEHRQAA